jgi:hypothetical protein
MRTICASFQTGRCPPGDYESPGLAEEVVFEHRDAGQVCFEVAPGFPQMSKVIWIGNYPSTACTIFGSQPCSRNKARHVRPTLAIFGIPVRGFLARAT